MSDCQYCAAGSGIYARTCPGCCARFCMSLPDRESSRRTAEKWCAENGLDIEQVRRIAQRMREERFQKAMRAPA